VNRFVDVVRAHGQPQLTRSAPQTVQLNVTKRCNLACVHCHVESSAARTEAMSGDTAQRVLSLIDASDSVSAVDLTGGSPELWEHFRPFVEQLTARGLAVLDRCNLTVFGEPGQVDTPEFLAENGVQITASLPCYTADNVDAQRGRKVFSRSISALQRLNALGYGQPGTGLVLDLVYNPVDAELPPPQAELDREYRERLRGDFAIEFNQLLTLANMPVTRWAQWLRRRGEYEAYLDLLVTHFNPRTVDRVMCRQLVSISHDGSLYDCDFNQQLELPLGGKARSVWDLASFDALAGEDIATGAHCFACTAGAGSSCGGALI